MFESSRLAQRVAATTLRPCRAVALAILLAACAAILAPAPPALAGGWPWPVDGEVITPYRNGDDRYAAGQHRGLDIAAPVGTSVRAVAAGEVTFAGRLPDQGTCVTIRSGRHLVSYLHLSAVAVKRGARAGAGSTIGSAGTSGKRSATAPHLHLSVRMATSGEYVDPLPLLGPKPLPREPASADPRGGEPKAAQPPVAQPVEQRAAERERQRARSRAESRARGERRSARGRTHAGRGDHARGRERAGARAPRTAPATPTDVHAPPPGDTVATAPASAVSGSAREGHASRGRVAPPPLRRGSQTRLAADDYGARPPGADSAATGRPVVRSAEPTAGRSGDRLGPGGTPWQLLAAVGACLLATLVALRRRRVTGPGPDEHDDAPLVARAEPAPAGDGAGEAEGDSPRLRVVAR